MALPTRIKLTLPFALAMAVVLAALGVFVYLRIGSTLLASIDQGLRGQATEAMTRLSASQDQLVRRLDRVQQNATS